MPEAPRLSNQRRPNRRRRPSEPEEMSVLVRIIVRSLLPIALIFALYIVSYGHLTPGGGFQGGIILVGAAMSIYLAYGYDIVRRLDDETLELAEHVGILIYLLVGLLGVFAGGSFLSNLFDDGLPGTLASGGIIPLLNVAVGFKVAAGALFVLVVLLQALKKGED